MRSQIYDAVVNTVSSIQSASARSSGSIRGSTRPMRDLDGFDSLNAVEATMTISTSIGCELKDDVGLFFNKQTGEARTIDEIVDAICDEVVKQESA